VVCGMGHPAAFHTRSAPSICAAPVIIVSHSQRAGAVDVCVRGRASFHNSSARSNMVIPACFFLSARRILVIGAKSPEVIP